MGREIRNVPKGWEHPKEESTYHGNRGEMVYRPMHEDWYEDEVKDWYNSHVLWLEGKHPNQLRPDASEWVRNSKYYAEYEGNAPDIERYNTFYNCKDKSVCTHFQIYETVSEGTPTSPVFETMDEMKKWLIQQGHSEKAAEGFCKHGSAPSMIFGGGVLKSNIDTFDM